MKIDTNSESWKKQFEEVNKKYTWKDENFDDEIVPYLKDILAHIDKLPPHVGMITAEQDGTINSVLTVEETKAFRARVEKYLSKLIN